MPGRGRFLSIVALTLGAFGLFSFAEGPARGQETRARFDDYEIVRITARSMEDIEDIEKSGGNILNCVHGPGPMDVLVSPNERRALSRRGFRMETVNRHVQSMVDVQYASSEAVVAGGDPFDDFFLAYHPYGDAETVGSIVWYMNELVTRYPSLASFINVGTTVEGRSILGLRITSDVLSEKPGVFYFSAEHAREWVTPPVTLFFANHLLENYGIDSGVTETVDNVEFFLVPVMNVDGYIYTWTTNRFWRKNRRHNGGTSFGVDLNRNWSQGWGGPGSSGSTTSDIYRGPSPFSEAETQAMRDFFIDHPNIRAQLDIHSFSQLILWPFGSSNTLPEDQDVYQEVGSGMRAEIFAVHGRTYIEGPTYSTIYPASGVSTDWTYDELGILSFAYECRDANTGQGLSGFDLPADQIIPQGEEMVPALMYLANSNWVRQATPPPSVAAAGSRYLEIHPAAGFSSISLRITSPDYPCLDKYVTEDGFLDSTPTVQSSSSWGTMYVGDEAILPETTYFVEADYGVSGTSTSVMVTTGKLADVAAEFGLINFSDVSTMVDCFRGEAGELPLAWCDISPLVPNRVVNFEDISVAINMFRGLPSPYGPPCP
jgi:murein tripeptide amidase MpaA